MTQRPPDADPDTRSTGHRAVIWAQESRRAQGAESGRQVGIPPGQGPLSRPGAGRGFGFSARLRNVRGEQGRGGRGGLAQAMSAWSPFAPHYLGTNLDHPPELGPDQRPVPNPRSLLEADGHHRDVFEPQWGPLLAITNAVLGVGLDHARNRHLTGPWLPHGCLSLANRPS